MSILINEDTRVVIQGITGKYGQSQAKTMIQYGTKVLAGVTPGKGGTTFLGVPLFDTVAEAKEAFPELNTSIMYVPPTKLADSAIEAIDAGMQVGMIAAEGVPLHDTIRLRAYAREKGMWIVGPNTIGLISPGKCLIGSLASEYGTPGRVGLVTRGGTIAVELIRMMSANGIGQTTCIGSGGDRVIFRNPIEYLERFEEDPDTEAVVLNGEIGGGKETEAAAFVKKMKKPVIAYIIGRSAPKGKRMGHAGAIVGSEAETWESKCAALRDAGAIVVETPWMMIDELKKLGMHKK